MNDFFTMKQQELVADFKGGKLKRINILEGSVRSGKTWISLVVFALWVATMPKNGMYLMVGKTLTTLKRNCLVPMERLIGKNNFRFSVSAKEAHLFGRVIYLEGASDARAEEKIRGTTLSGAYGDEVSLLDEDFFTMLLSRLSEPGAKFFGTTNPDNPQHWFKKKYLDKAENISLYTRKFIIDDNTKLDAEYVVNIKAE